MSKSFKGRLAALIATTLFLTSHAMGQSASATVDLTGVAPEEAAQFQAAIAAGPAQLVAFMQAFPQSTLIGAVISALAEEVGVQQATQMAINAGVPTDAVVRTAATLSNPAPTNRAAPQAQQRQVDIGQLSPSY